MRTFTRFSSHPVTILVAIAALTPAVAERVQLVAQCPAGTTPMPALQPDAGVWELEGRLSAFDRSARTLTANGMTVVVPGDVLVQTGDEMFITLDDLLDPGRESVRTVLGGTVIAGGIVHDPEADGCAVFLAGDVFFEFAENVALGALTAVDAGTSTFFVNGIAVRMNDDPRVPADLLDASGNPDITVADLEGFEGTAVTTGGYFENGALRGVVVETAAFKPCPGTDCVIIEDARWDSQDGELRVGGFVTPQGASTVDLFAPGDRTADGTACEGTFVARLTLIADVAEPDRATFSFRSASFPNQPEKVCVRSAGGGVNRRTVAAR